MNARDLFGSGPAFVEPRAFAAWASQAALKTAALGTVDGIQAAQAAYDGRTVGPTVIGTVALINITGPILYRSSWLSVYYGMAAIEDLQVQLRLALADPGVKTILFRVDSPGGVIDMCPEFADELFAARGQKPMIAVADTLIASAAYWLVSQMDTIYTSTSALVGSVGVFCGHVDIGKMLEQAGITVTLIAHGENKVQGNQYEPLSERARATLQAAVDQIGGWFEAAVARGRGVTKAQVLESFGQGDVFYGKDAIARGLADKMGTFSAVFAKLAKGQSISGATSRAKVDAPTPQASADDTEDDGCPDCDPECPCDTDEPCEPGCPTCSKTCGCAKASTDDGDEQARADAEALLYADRG